MGAMRRSTNFGKKRHFFVIKRALAFEPIIWFWCLLGLRIYKNNTHTYRDIATTGLNRHQCRFSEKTRRGSMSSDIIKRPGVARAVLQTPLSLIDSVSQSSFSSQSSRYQKSQTIKARELKFERIFIPHNMSHAMCHMSHVTCHVSHVKCQMLCVTCHNFYL